MADIHYLSAELESFRQIYDGSSNFDSVKNNEIDSLLLNISNDLNEAYSNISSAVSDTQGTELCQMVDLARSGIDSIKNNIPNNIDPLLSECQSVRQNIIEEIIKKYKYGKTLPDPEWYEDAWNSTGGALFNDLKTEKRKAIDKVNNEIDRLNKMGWDQLNAISSAINSVDFKIIGNMVKGGSVGSAVTFMDNYSFTQSQWEKDNPVYELKWYQELGCLAVGAVESVCKAGEGLLDFGATAIGSVVSIFDKNAGKSFTDFAATDHVGNFFDGVVETAGLSADAYHQSNGRRIGGFAGSVVAHGALWMTGAGAVISALSIGGNTAEDKLQDGASAGEALLAGAGSALLSYGLGHGAKALGAWATSTGSNTVIGHVYNAASQPFGAGWSARVPGLLPKVVNVAASPIRGLGNVAYRGSRLLGVYDSASGTVSGGILKNSKNWSRLGKLDTRADSLANRLVGGTLNKVVPGARRAVRAGSGTPGSTPGTTPGSTPGTTPGNTPGTTRGSSGTNTTSFNTPESYKINQDAWDELLADGYVPNTPEFGEEAVHRYAGAVNPHASSAASTGFNTPEAYGISQEAADELLAEGYVLNTPEFGEEAVNRFAGAKNPHVTSTATTAGNTSLPKIELPEYGTTNEDIMNALKKMNPGVDFNLDSSGTVLTTSADPSKLNLPKGYEYNPKNGITNKHNTVSGNYNSLTTRQEPSI